MDTSKLSCDPPNLHVLVVDDNNIDRKLIQKILEISSFKVSVVDSGSKALQYLGLDEENTSPQFDGLKVNLIISDYSMPGMTGFELLKKIKNSSTFRDIPVVITSSENNLTRINRCEALRCLEEGAEEYLLKPVKLSDVNRLKESINKSGSEHMGQHEQDQSVDCHGPTPCSPEQA